MSCLWRAAEALALLGLLAPCVGAQMDPERRRLVQMGFDQPMSGPGPDSLYLFYYSNQPNFPRKDMTLRLALAPVYIDSELGFRHVPFDNIDAGLGLAGGGFAESYSEVRRGHFYREESFLGHGATASTSLYTLLNPEQTIPLILLTRGEAHMALYARGGDTAANFTLPPDHMDFRFRAGLRLGGEPPKLHPSQSAEVSVWYVAYLRDRSASYGYAGDRALESRSHLFWGRTAGSYECDSGKYFQASVEAGGSSNPDRLDAYRIGGLLPFASESPLSLPGYYNGEFSASRYVLIGGFYSQPLDEARRVTGHAFFDAANVVYLPGMDQPHPWNEGIGIGLGFDTPKRVWRLELNYAFGIDAHRSRGRGAHSASFLAQIDLHAWKHGGKAKPLKPKAKKPEGMDWLIEILRP